MNTMANREIKISEVLKMIESGKTRKDISEELKLSSKEKSSLFNHPLIKDRRAGRSANDLVIIDDVTPQETNQQILLFSEE